MRTRLLTALLIPCLAMAQDKSRELEEQLSRRDSNSKTDVRATFLLGMAQVTDSQTKKDLASSGQGAAVGFDLDFPFHNYFVLGAHLGGVWLRERDQDYSYISGANFNSQFNAFEIGAVSKYFLLDKNAMSGPYLLGALQWTRWKKYIAIDFQDTTLGKNEAKDKTTFTPTIGVGWCFTRHLGLDIRYTRTRYLAELAGYPNLTRDWNLDHLAVSASFRFGGK